MARASVGNDGDLYRCALRLYRVGGSETSTALAAATATLATAENAMAHAVTGTTLAKYTLATPASTTTTTSIDYLGLPSSTASTCR
uniref:Uncharacterized protein n=1 Tax=Oryza sativa subsp. japonica TaxID=39947 RepID=Q5VQ82_ORYSJ|nr:hypothetical protein [Oryza sativa Japonica Group]BAD68393.1 hypothetical protein [Oryza sativa Japonica Group]